MKTGVKLTLGFSFIVLAMLLTVAFCLNTGKKIHEEFEALKDDIIPGAITMVEMDRAAINVIHETMEYIIHSEEEEAIMASLKLLKKAGTEHLKHEKYIGVDEKKEAEELMVKINRFASVCTEIINLKKQGLSSAELLEKEEQSIHPALELLTGQLTEHKATHMEELAAAEERVHEAHVSSKRIALLVSAIVASLAVVIAFATTRSITKPLTALRRGTEIIGSGKLDYKVATDARDEIGQLSRAFDKMTVNLSVSVDELNAANQQLNANNQQLRASEQQLRAANQQLDAKNQQLRASEQQLRATNQQLNANNQQLQASEQHLKAINQQLESEITERKKAEQALEKSNRELKEFTYVASHDLREPLRKISSFGKLLSDSLKDKLSKDDEENLEFMIDGASRMQQMIEALLTYSRVTTKAVESVPVDLNKVVEELCGIELAVKIEETGTEIEVPERLGNIKCDPAQIRQLMQNFIANAIKYQKKDTTPEVVIRTRSLDDGMVRVEVQDNGIGIKEDHFKNVFVMFKRLHSMSEYEGTGIGLAVCKKIVERHGGNIGVSSTYGEGSTFWFTMPAVKEFVPVSVSSET